MRHFLPMLLCCALVTFGQANPPAFEVASVKPHPGPLHSIGDFQASGPTLSLQGYNSLLLIREAYGIKDYQVSLASPNLPAEGFYDLTAKAEGNGSPTRSEFREMLKTLLADRFKLQVHREMREMPVYELTVDKKGLRLKPAGTNGPCQSLIGPDHPEDRLYRYRFTNCPLSSLVETLQAGRPILDKTGLTGRYDINMFATPDSKLRDSSEPGDISPFNAVRELGLKLEARKDNIEVLVVDHLEKPSPN